MKMIYISMFMAFSISTLCATNTDLSSANFIKDPSISRRCHQMLKKREKKIKFRQQLEALSKRNLSLQKKVPTRKKNLLRKLRRNHINLKGELFLSSKEITNMTETIIKKGCPGITL